jgi:hypothetical protein
LLDLWQRYTLGEEPADAAEAAAFDTFRANDRNAWARHEPEREARQRYLDGEEPAGEAQQRWFEIFRQEATDSYAEELRAWHRYANGKPAQDAAQLSRFARFDRELAEHGRTPPHRHAQPEADFEAGS